MLTVCVGLVFRSKYVQFYIICSPQYSINIITVEVNPHSDLLHICIAKPKNSLIAHAQEPMKLLHLYELLYKHRYPRLEKSFEN